MKWKNRLRNLVLRAILFSWTLGAYSLLLAAPREKVDNSAGVDKTGTSIWAVPYILVILVILLGVAVLCSPVRRDDKKRAED